METIDAAARMIASADDLAAALRAALAHITELEDENARLKAALIREAARRERKDRRTARDGLVRRLTKENYGRAK